MRRSNDLDIGKAVMALFYGTILGAFLTTLVFVLPSVLAGPSEMTPGQAGIGSVYIFTVAFFLWGAGVLMLGAPLWAALHALGFRGYLSAGLLGFALPVLALMVPAITRDGPATPDIWTSALFGASVFGAIGLAVGLYIRFLAYQKG
jgi:hypothetical protein